MENLLTFCVACVHSDAGEDVFIWFKVIWLCSGWGDICLWSHSSWRDASPWSWELFLHFSWHKWLLIPRKGTCYLSLLSFSLYRSHTDNMCTQTVSPQWMTVWMYLINEWVTLLLCYYDDFSLLCITSCNRGFCSVTFATINTLWVHSFRLCGDFSQPCKENIYLIFQITFGVSFVYK